MKNFNFSIKENIAYFGFNVPDKSMNVIDFSVIEDIEEIAQKLNEVKGAIIYSEKSNFCAGADLFNLLSGIKSAKPNEMFEKGFAFNAALRKIETSNKPLVCIINGLALGGGLEFALACNYIICNEGAKIGLPEAKIGLIPGGGGTQRLSRMIGVQNAASLLLEGKELKAAEALKIGIINEINDNGFEAATYFIANNPKVSKAWDSKNYKPKDGPYTPNGIMNFIGGNAMISGKTFGNYPAQLAILSAFYEGLQLPFDSAIKIESRYFIKNLLLPSTQSMARTLFVSSQALAKGSNRPQGFEKYEIKKAAVLGAGMMGAGIAYQQAINGILTILIDTSIEAANKGKAHCEELLKKQVSRQKMSEVKAKEILDLIIPSIDFELIKGADIIIEAVFENREIKADVTKKSESLLSDNAVFGTNTSTLPITSLALASSRPNNFIGIHFFSPVEKMPLVEIIKGEETTNETIAKAIDYVLKIKKTPIIVNDERGFYTSRCFSTYITEGVELLAEGYSPILIENIGKMTGMPVAPLAMSDEVALDLAYKIQSQAKKDLGDKYIETKATKIIEEMVVKYERFGRKNKKGFYDYFDDGTKEIWADIHKVAPCGINEISPNEVGIIKKRLLYRQAIEAVRCFEERVIQNPIEADIGSIFGWGFAPYTGGVISMIDNIGSQVFCEELTELAEKYGSRFTPNNLLLEMAKTNQKFYERFK